MSTMRFTSTRHSAPEVGFSDAIVNGIAPDGGLYLPTEWPRADLDSFGDAGNLPGVGARFIAPFLTGDRLESELTRPSRQMPSISPLRSFRSRRDERLSVLELFHGPTAAFKDFGARFLAACMSTRPRAGRSAPADSRCDLGRHRCAVAAAFHNRPGIGVSVLFPKGLVSPTQERQLTCWGGNVRSFSVRGTFDDCQRMVKDAFADPQLRSRMQLSSANSINLGRLLPQAVYYAASSLAIWRKHGERAVLHRAERQSRQRDGVLLGAQGWPAHRRHRASRTI
ncbi:MAG: hypothetical protein WDO56_03665 [Gammaproteobacteria bacterium]